MVSRAAVDDDLVGVGETALVDQVVADELEDDGGVQGALQNGQDTDDTQGSARTPWLNSTRSTGMKENSVALRPSRPAPVRYFIGVNNEKVCRDLPNCTVGLVQVPNLPGAFAETTTLDAAAAVAAAAAASTVTVTKIDLSSHFFDSKREANR